MKTVHAIFYVLLAGGLPLLAQPAAQVVSLQGSVQIRRGLEESWQLAAAGMPLEAVDTILTGEKSEVLLQAPDGARLRLGANIILDIADVKRLSEREMFLWLMSEKIDQLPEREVKAPLRFGQITSVHGEEKSNPVQISTARSLRWRAEANGVLALLDNEYRTNAVVKCHKILRRYPEQQDCGEIHVYLGRALESLAQSGQAVEAYQTALQRLQSGACDDQILAGRRQGIEESLQRLRNDKPIK